MNPATSLVAIVALTCTANVRAAIILETATLGPSQGSNGVVVGTGLDESQWLGARFTLDSTYRITAIGGHLRFAPSRGMGWGAIVPMPAIGLPGFAPMDIEANALAFATIPQMRLTSDIRVPIDAVLDAGDYGVVLGGGPYFGASDGSGIMPDAGQSNLLPDSRFRFIARINPLNPAQATWSQLGEVPRLRLVVEGEAFTPQPIPEPTSLIAWSVLALIGTGFYRRRRHKAA